MSESERESKKERDVVPVRVSMRACVYMYACLRLHVGVCARTFACVRTCVHVCTYVCYLRGTLLSNIPWHTLIGRVLGGHLSCMYVLSDMN